MAQFLVMRSFRQRSVISTILLLFFLGGCSGGSSGPPPTLNYSGVTTPAVINADNARTLLAGAYEGGVTTAVFNIFGAAEVAPAMSINKPRISILAEALATFLYEVDLQPQQLGPYTGAIITDSETIFGSCGGSVYYEVGIDSIFGDFSGTADFRDYCDINNPDLVLDGITDFSGDFEVLTQEIDDFSFIFRDLAGMNSEGSYTLNGSLNGSVSSARADVITTSVIKDDISGKTYWLKDFLVTVVQGGSFVDITADGRYYDHDYGYVDVSTVEPFRLYSQDDWPASGILTLTGAEGSAGGSTGARMVILDASSFQVEADTDGDGQYDDHAPEPIYW